jgi:hypothetical protein
VKKIIEIRVVTHTNDGTPGVAIIFDDGTQTFWHERFETPALADAFAAGIRAAADLFATHVVLAMPKR